MTSFLGQNDIIGQNGVWYDQKFYFKYSNYHAEQPQPWFESILPTYKEYFLLEVKATARNIDQFRDEYRIEFTDARVKEIFNKFKYRLEPCFGIFHSLLKLPKLYQYIYTQTNIFNRYRISVCVCS